MQSNEGYVIRGDGGRLYYRVVGSGSTSVIIPNARLLAAELTPLAQGRQLIFYDQRGRGASDTIEDENLTWLDYEVADIEQVRQYFGLERVMLVGWSYMGAMAALYAQKYPEYVSRLVMVCPIPIRHPAPYDQEQITAWEQANARLDPERVAQLETMKKAGKEQNEPIAFCREQFKTNTPRQMGKPETLANMKSDPCVYSNEWPRNLSQHWQKHFPPSSQERDWRERVATLDIPTLILHGKEDLIPLRASQEWSQTLPNARLVTLSESGHFPHLEAPKRYFSLIDRFLNGQWPKEVN